MWLCVLCLSISAWRSEAEIIDDHNARWQGTAWQANRLDLAGLTYQSALFPLITQGPGAFSLPSGAFVLRLHVLPLNSEVSEPVLVLWGRVADPLEKPLAWLFLRKGRLIWVCPIDPKGDSLFDAPKNVELENKALTPGLWATIDVLVNPLPYQQTFGWNLEINHPQDPAKQSGTPLHLARQLTAADWSLQKIEVPRLRAAWLGQMELLPANTPSAQLRPNIIRQ